MNGWEQLKSLQEFSRTTGALHEAQILQLKMWPQVAFPHLKKHSFTWDMSDHRVCYKFQLDPKKKAPRNLRTRFDALDKHIKDMLGDEWSIEVKAASKKIYESHGRVPEPTKRPDDPGPAPRGKTQSA